MRPDGKIGPLHFALCPHHKVPSRNEQNDLPVLLQPETGEPANVMEIWPKLRTNVRNNLRELIYIVEDTFPLEPLDDDDAALGKSAKRKRSAEKASSKKKKQKNDKVEIKWHVPLHSGTHEQCACRKNSPCFL